MTIAVNADLFKLATHAMSTEEVRYYLNGVHIEAHPEKGAIMVSTDGHRLVAVYDEDGECDEPVIVNLPKAALDAPRGRKKVSANPDERLRWIIDAKAKTASLVGQTVNGADDPVVAFSDVLVDGTFPDWRRVVPKAVQPIGPAGFSSKYVGAIAALASAIRQDKSASAMRFLSAGGTEGEPALIRFDGAPHIFAVLMPMRIDEPGTRGIPPFMAPAKVQRKPATKTKPKAARRLAKAA